MIQAQQVTSSSNASSSPAVQLQNTTTSNADSTQSPNTPNIRDIMHAQTHPTRRMECFRTFQPSVTLAQYLASTHTSSNINHAQCIQGVSTSHSEFAPVDGGADTVLMGSAFQITDTYPHRLVDLEGFSEDLVTNNVPIGSGITL